MVNQLRWQSGRVAQDCLRSPNEVDEKRQIFIGSGPAEKSRTKAWWRAGRLDQVVRRNSLTSGFGNVPLWVFNRFSPFARLRSRSKKLL